MTRYEFTHAIVPRRDGASPSYSDHADPNDVDAVLNKYGAAGWHLYALDGSIARFEREIVERRDLVPVDLIKASEARRAKLA
jgi:hypothetical protein